MAVAGEADEDVCADSLAVGDHLEPADGWHVAEVSVFVRHFVDFPCQAARLAQRWISDAEAPVGPPWECCLGVRRPSPHDCEDVCRVVVVELVVVDFADGIEGDQRGDGEVAGEEEKKLVVCAESIE